MKETELEQGDFAVDEAKEDSPRMLITEVTDQTADEYVLWEEPSGKETTVADHPSNKACDPESQVVKAVYWDALSNVYDAWSASGVLALRVDDDLDVKEYSFPSDRLSKIEIENE